MLRWLSFAWLLGLVGCSSVSGPGSAPVVPPVAAEATAEAAASVEDAPGNPDRSTLDISGAVPIASAANAQRWQRLVDAELERVAAIRGLPATRAVSAELLSRAELASRVTNELAEQLPAGVVRAEEALLSLLGVVPPGFDLLGALRVLLLDTLAGYYDPATGRMVLAQDLGERDLDLALSHELVHALQDQHYDLARFLDFQPDASDWQSAMHGLAEGDATASMIVAAQGAKDTAQDVPQSWLGFQMRAAVELGTDARVPSIIKHSLVAPYTDGFAFVEALRQRGGWKLVDQAWQRGLPSTEQLLHVERFLSGELPEAVPLPPAPSDLAEPSLELRDVLGEQAIRLLLGEWVARRSAESAAEGWAGDRVAVYQAGNSYWLAWHLRYDDKKEAAEAASAFYRGLWGNSAAPKLPRGPVCRERPELPPIALVVQNREIVLTSGGPRETRCRELLNWARLTLSSS